MSGPAVLKLSAWGARELAERDYGFTIQVNWVGVTNEADVLAQLEKALPGMLKKKMANACPFDLPKNFWIHALEKAGIDPDSPWAELGKKPRNRLINGLLNDTYTVAGKTTFKEEFVTCGGVTLDEVDFNTMESRVVPGLHFAGEVLDVDGITGGFHFRPPGPPASSLAASVARPDPQAAGRRRHAVRRLLRKQRKVLVVDAHVVLRGPRSAEVSVEQEPTEGQLMPHMQDAPPTIHSGEEGSPSPTTPHPPGCTGHTQNPDRAVYVPRPASAPGYHRTCGSRMMPRFLVSPPGYHG